jgi:hypothetical protein
MQRQVDPNLLLMVEGDDENVILNGHLDPRSVTLLVMGGKPNVLGASRRLLVRQEQTVLAVIDRDMDDLTGQSAGYPSNVAPTRGYDLATDINMVRPDLLDRAIMVHGRSAASNIERQTGVKVSDLAFNLCLALAPLRLVNLRRNLELNLRDFPFDKIICANYDPKESEEIVRVANIRSRVSASFESIGADLDEAAGQIRGERRFCGGHDLMRAVCALLRKGGASKVSSQSLAASIYTATDCQTIELLPVSQPISDWAARHSRTAFICKSFSTG